MNKKKKALIIIVSIILVICIIGVVIYAVIQKMASNMTFSDSTLGDYPEYFGLAPVTDSESIFADYSSMIAAHSDVIEAGMSATATAEQKALAAYAIYRIGCYTREMTAYQAKYSTGGGSATGDLTMGSTVFKVGATMNLTSTYYDIRYPVTTPTDIASIYDGTYKMYSVNEEYTQIPGGAVWSEPDSIQNIGQILLGSMLPFARRGISTPDYRCTWHGEQDSSVIEENRVTATFDANAGFDIKTGEQLQESNSVSRQYPEDYWDEYGLSAHDISVHIINPDTIDGNSVVIEYKTGEEAGLNVLGEDMGYYSVKFSLKYNLEEERSKDDTTDPSYYAVQLYLQSAPQAFMDYLSYYNLYYTKLDVEMTIFDNGYMRTWSTDEVWEMTGGVSLVSADAVITTKNFSKEAYCYDRDTIMQGFVNRYYGDNPNVAKPITELPFYSELEGYSKEDYGTYR